MFNRDRSAAASSPQFQSTKRRGYAPNDAELVARFVAYKRVERGLSENTIHAYTLDMEGLVASLAGQGVTLLTATRDHIRAHLSALYERKLSARTIARHISCLRSLYRFLQIDGYLERDPMLVIEAPRLPRTLPRTLAVTEVETLLTKAREAATTPNGMRDYAMLETMFACGLRTAEIVGLTVRDLNLDARQAVVWGKGSKERTVPLHAAAVELLRRYMAETRPCLLRGRESPFLFVGAQSGQGLSRKFVWRMVQDAAKRAGLRPFGGHALRHACATALLEGGADLRTIQTILGHADISTTEIYTHASVEHLRAVYTKCHPRGAELQKRAPAESA